MAVTSRVFDRVAFNPFRDSYAVATIPVAGLGALASHRAPAAKMCRRMSPLSGGSVALWAQPKRSGMSRPHRGKMPTVSRQDFCDIQTFCRSDHGRVHEPKSQVRVLLEQL